MFAQEGGADEADDTFGADDDEGRRLVRFADDDRSVRFADDDEDDGSSDPFGSQEAMEMFAESGGAAKLSETAQVEIVSEEEDDFEFAFSIDSDPGSLSDTTADEIFYNGKILPVYPVFNRDLIGRTGNPKVMEEEDRSNEGFQTLENF